MVIGSISISIYVYSNQESSSSINLITKVLIVNMAAVLFIVFEVLQPVKSDDKTVKILMLRSNSGPETHEFSTRLSIISRLNTGYSIIDKVNIFSPKPNNNHKDISLDLIENVFWVWLSSNYHLHWEVDKVTFYGISGWQGTIDIAKNADKKTTQFKREELIKYLTNSHFEISPAHFWGVQLPVNTEIIFLERDSYERTILIKNKHIMLKVRIHSIGKSGLNYTVLGERIIKSLSENYPMKTGFIADDIIIEFSCEYKRLLKGSLSTKKQQRWVNEIMDNSHSEFDWDELRPDVERAYGL